MEVLILLSLLVLFWVYISWDKDRVEAQAKADAKHRPRGTEASPRAVITMPSLFVAAASLGAMAAILAIQPPAPPFSGRLSWITALLYSLFGKYGPAATTAALALVCIAGAMACLRKRQG